MTIHTIHIKMQFYIVKHNRQRTGDHPADRPAMALDGTFIIKVVAAMIRQPLGQAFQPGRTGKGVQSPGGHAFGTRLWLNQ